MNVPVLPPVDLAPLANLSLDKKNSGVVTVASTAMVAGAVAILAWRLAPYVAHQRKLARARSRAPWIAFGIGAMAAGVVVRWQLQRLFAGEPDQNVEERRGSLEIRRYASQRIARTTVEGTWEHALDKGFGRLAGFIFGGNAEKKRISMTSPVTSARDGDGYRVAFLMPDGVEAPAPDDSRIALDEVPARRVAVLRFNGRWDGEFIEAKKRELVAAAEEAGLTHKGEPLFAAYDPPSTLPVLRRNEVWVEVEG